MLLRLKLRKRARGCWADGDDTLLYGPIRESSVADESDGRRPAQRNRGKRETTRHRPITTEQPNNTPRIFPAPGKIYLFSSFFFTHFIMVHSRSNMSARAHTRYAHFYFVFDIPKENTIYVYMTFCTSSIMSIHACVPLIPKIRV